MKRRLVLVTTLFLLGASLFAQNDLQPLAVVKYNRSETITLKQLKTRVEFFQKQNGVVYTPEQRAIILDDLIKEKLIVQAAAKEGLTVSDSEVTMAFLNLLTNGYGSQATEAQLETMIRQQTGLSMNDYVLARTGMGLTDYKAYLKNQIISQKYIYVKNQAEFASVVATDAEIRSAYELNKQNFIWNDMALVFVVMVPKENDATTARALATQLRNQYVADPSSSSSITADTRNGSVFQAGPLLIQKTSAQAAELGWSTEQILELFAMDTGYVSELSDSGDLIQFFAVQKKYAGGPLALSDIIQPETTITVYEYLKSTLTEQKQNLYYANAVQQLYTTLDTPANVERKKTGADLTALLNW